MHEIAEEIKTIDLEINDLEKFETIIVAAETDDELGSVLRLHLAVVTTNRPPILTGGFLD